jgi:hypothetical protein
VTRPETTLRELAGFLELPYAPEMAAFHEGKTRHDSGLSAKKAWLPPTPGLRDWRAQVSERDAELFEALAGDLLSELGYERSIETVSPGVASVADRCKEWWESELARRRAKQARRELMAKDHGSLPSSIAPRTVRLYPGHRAKRAGEPSDTK